MSKSSRTRRITAAQALLEEEQDFPMTQVSNVEQKAESINIGREHGLTTEEIEEFLGVDLSPSSPRPKRYIPPKRKAKHYH